MKVYGANEATKAMCGLPATEKNRCAWCVVTTLCTVRAFRKYQTRPTSTNHKVHSIFDTNFWAVQCKYSRHCPKSAFCTVAAAAAVVCGAMKHTSS